MSHTLFISDLHLHDTRPHTTALFLTFLKKKAVAADALYILGDFFESWLGDDEHTPLSLQVESALHALSETGTPIYFMHGNHDFLLGNAFAQRAGMTLIKDPSLLNLYGQQVLLMHGDSLCINDIHHQRFRRAAHNPFLQWLFLSLPLKLRQYIGKKVITHVDNKYDTDEHTQQFMAIPEEAVQHVMRQHQVHRLIHGHTHQSNIHDVALENTTGARIVLPPWDKKGGALVFKENGSYTLISIEQDK